MKSASSDRSYLDRCWSLARARVYVTYVMRSAVTLVEHWERVDDVLLLLAVRIGRRRNVAETMGYYVTGVGGQSTHKNRILRELKQSVCDV